MTRPEAALPSAPAEPPPPGAWDCHVHLFGPEDRFPFASERSYTPGLATPGTLGRMLDRMGIAHAVVVQPSPYGDDHDCLIEGLHAMAGRCAGVAAFVGDARPADRLLSRLDEAGVCGLRVHGHRRDIAELTAALPGAAALARELGWHLELHLARRELDAAARALDAFAAPVVLDHMARLTLADLPRIEALAAARPLWLKLSGLYRQDDPAAARQVAQALLRRLPGRCLWGSDWPHTPPHPAEPAAALEPQPFRPVDATAELAAVTEGSTEPQRREMLAVTPLALYRPTTARS